MKLRPLTLLLTAFACLNVVQSSSAYIALTNPATVNNTNNFGGPGADPGDSFSVPNGTFLAYIPGAGDPTITGGDLNKYHFALSGTVQSVSSLGVVTYSGAYRIFYDADNSNSFNTGDFNYSSGNLSLTVDFANPGIFGYTTNGVLQQTAGPSPGFPSTGFATTDANFAGIYVQNPTNAALGTIQGTIQSAPDTGSTLALLGLATLCAFAIHRRVIA